MTTIKPYVGVHQPLTRRARFDIATLITTGVASTVFFLLPLWAPLDRSTVSSGGDVTPLASAAPAAKSAVATVSLSVPIDAPSAAPRPRRRAAIRTTRAVMPAPSVVQVQAQAKPTQSRLSRLLLGDGSEPVQPFPLADRRSER